MAVIDACPLTARVIGKWVVLEELVRPGRGARLPYVFQTCGMKWSGVWIDELAIGDWKPRRQGCRMSKPTRHPVRLGARGSCWMPVLRLLQTPIHVRVQGTYCLVAPARRKAGEQVLSEP